MILALYRTLSLLPGKVCFSGHKSPAEEALPAVGLLEWSRGARQVLQRDAIGPQAVISSRGTFPSAAEFMFPPYFATNSPVRILHHLPDLSRE